MLYYFIPIIVFSFSITILQFLTFKNLDIMVLVRIKDVIACNIVTVKSKFLLKCQYN